MSEETTPVPKKKAGKTKSDDLKKLKLLFTVVNREKADYYMDLLQSYEVNLQLTCPAAGTATLDQRLREVIALSGDENKKYVIVSVVRQDRVKEILAVLEEKFHTLRNGKGIAFTVAMTSTIGVAIYRFLSNAPQ